jgi:hypothetical protein
MAEVKTNIFEYVNQITNNKADVIRKEMIKFLKETVWPDELRYIEILEFINDFFIEDRTNCKKCFEREAKEMGYIECEECNRFYHPENDKIHEKICFSKKLEPKNN